MTLDKSLTRIAINQKLADFFTKLALALVPMEIKREAFAKSRAQRHEKDQKYERERSADRLVERFGALIKSGHSEKVQAESFTQHHACESVHTLLT